MHELVLTALLGSLGGLTRGVLGLFKAIAKKKKILWKCIVSMNTPKYCWKAGQ